MEPHQGKITLIILHLPVRLWYSIVDSRALLPLASDVAGQMFFILAGFPS